MGSCFLLLKKKSCLIRNECLSAIPLSSQQFPGFYHSLLHSWFKDSPSTFSAMSWRGPNGQGATSRSSGAKKKADHCWILEPLPRLWFDIRKKKSSIFVLEDTTFISSYDIHIIPQPFLEDIQGLFLTWHCSCYIRGCLHPSDIIPQPWDSISGPSGWSSPLIQHM